MTLFPRPTSRDRFTAQPSPVFLKAFKSLFRKIDRIVALTAARCDDSFSGRVLESALKAVRPTILDVAERAGVSAGTVSNVVNGSVRVSGRRKQRVLDAIDELSYTRNPLAQGLGQKRTPVVGVCVPHTSVAYFSKLVDAFEEVALSRGFEIMQIVSHDNPRIEQKRVSSLLNYRVGGISWCRPHIRTKPWMPSRGPAHRWSLWTARWHRAALTRSPSTIAMQCDRSRAA
jgi:transcriptional regulator with XRE-family HTH domain